MARSPVKKVTSVVKKAAAKVKATTKKAAKKVTGKSSTTSPAKRPGDVLGISSTRVPKAKTPLKKAGGARKRSIGVVKRSTGIDHLTPARVRG